MKKIVLTFGLLSGALSALMMFGTVPFLDRIGYDRAAVVGYTAIVISFLFVYFGVRSYRDNVAGGTLTFGKAFGVGILITLISCVCYVVAWEIVYFKMMPDFVDRYTAYGVEHLKATGGTPAAIEALKAEMESFRKLYDNPLTNAAITFTEPFPIGLLITIISAAVLRKKS